MVPETGQTLDDFGVNPIPLENVGTAQLDFDQVLVAEEDTLEAEVLTLYFDAFYLLDNGIEIKNQLLSSTTTSRKTSMGFPRPRTLG